MSHQDDRVSDVYLPFTMTALLGSMASEVDQVTERNEESCCSRFMGFTLAEDAADDYASRLPPSWTLIPEFSEGPYRQVWICEAACAIFTYCEGDLILDVYDTAEAYEQALEDSVKFYSQT